jgi:hypothetical protein
MQFPVRFRMGFRATAVMALSVLATGCEMTESHTGTPADPALQRTVLTLEQRKTRLEDVNDIKRLQGAYGYYFSTARWDEVTNLFSDGATIEIGLDGVYRGKQRVREYLHAFGGGKEGLAPGQLNEYLQAMPVITLSPDGQTAKGTWRAIVLTGQLGGAANWGEGPYENEYVKENGVWKFSKLHWYQTLLVPFEGGWMKHEDVNATKFVAGRLPPDSPPTVNYKSWPSAFVPPFHFKDKPQVVVPEPPRLDMGMGETESTAALLKRAAVLEQEVKLIDAQYRVETLQRIYGYYLDKGFWSQAADLFADNGEIEVEGRGAHVGKDHVLRYLRAIGPEGPAAGRLYDHMQLAPVVHVAPDGKTAKGRWMLFAQLARQKDFHEWGTGVYENEYVNEGGVWKIRKLHLYPTMYTPYDEGWAKTQQRYSKFEPEIAADRGPADRGPADRASASQASASSLPAAGAARAPYHFANPATGKQVFAKRASDFAAAPAVSAEAAAQSLTALDHRIGLLEDEQQIENLHSIYGYYLATLEWDTLANLFTDDGTIEIALRGVYVGKAGVRRNLNLYGQQGLDNGVLHNHMQFQPVIDVAPDGKTAKIRSRAFSMLGNFKQNALWMAGIYENEFVKVNGEWKFRKDQVINSYFAPYDVGWKTLAPREAPGITPSNPPDRPPSFHFDMFPKPYVPAFHYNNPVTGQSVTWP